MFELVHEYKCSLPLRLELDAVLRVLGTLSIEGQTCLDVGFSNPVTSRGLRRTGGYWSSAVWTPTEAAAAAEMLGETVLQVGPGGQLPFEDKQFSVVVLGRGRLTGSRVHDEALVHECHRVLKTPGYLILNCDFAKPGLGRLLGGSAAASGYTEAQLFDLLKMGFDVLGMRTYCRFWVQLVRLLLDRPGHGHGLGRLLYSLAYQLDLLIFFTRGHQVMAYGRRKGWRPRQTPVLSDGRSISEAVLRPYGR